MLATLWFNRPCGEDLLISLRLCDVHNFLQDLIYRGSTSEVFTEDDPPVFSTDFWYNGIFKGTEMDILQINGIHVFLCKEGFQPPCIAYSKIFTVPPKVASWIITGIPRPYTENEIEKQVNPQMRGFLANQDGFRRTVLKETLRQLPPRFLVVKDMEEYVSLFIGRPALLKDREDSYDLCKKWN